MEDWQERVCKEADELNERILKLFRFIGRAASCSYDDRIVLRKQRDAMIAYSDVLIDRISNFPTAGHKTK